MICENLLLRIYGFCDLQPGLSGINLGKFLIKRVIDVVRRDMPTISVSLLFLDTFRFWLAILLSNFLKWEVKTLASKKLSPLLASLLITHPFIAQHPLGLKLSYGQVILWEIFPLSSVSKKKHAGHMEI